MRLFTWYECLYHQDVLVGLETKITLTSYVATVIGFVIFKIQQLSWTSWTLHMLMLGTVFVQANVAKLESSLAVTGDKIDLKLFGFNEKLPVLAQKIAELLTSLVPREDRFQVCWFPSPHIMLSGVSVCWLPVLKTYVCLWRVLNRNYILWSMQVIKEDIERAYRNANMKPLKHSAYLRLQALKERFWHADDKLACLLSLTVKDVTDFIPQLFNQVISTLPI